MWLQEDREALEKRVAERPAELRATNQRLRAEIAERKQIETMLREREQRYRDVFDNTSDGVVLLEVCEDLRFRFISINPTFERLAQLSSAEAAGKYIEDYFPPEPAQKLTAIYRQCLELAATIDYESSYEWPAGFRTDHATAIPVRDEHQRIHRIAVISRDVTERKALERVLRKRESEFRLLVENSPDMIARYDRDCRCIYANPALLKAARTDASGVLGKTPDQWPAGDSGRIFQKTLQDVLQHGEVRDLELNWKAGEEKICCHLRISPEFDDAGKVTHILVVGRDITEIDRYRKKIHHQAFYDPLTGLPNRLLLSDRIAQTIADARYHGRQFGLMLLDLDHFKNVNDTLGHSVGDRLLHDAATRMQACLRSYDTVARLGGDEFAILLPELRKGDDISTIAGNILLRLAEPFIIDGRELFVTGSIGIALFPIDSDDIDALYKYADSAMYQAKKLGRNNFQFYASEFTRRSLERMETDSALRKAQRQGEFELHYQPQIDLRTRRLTGAEALLRWRRRGYGLVGPDRFIPHAEETGIILEIGEWVLRTACRDAVAWNQEADVPIKVSVNLSTRQFVRNDIVATVSSALNDTGCRPAWLELEITENLLLEDSKEIADALTALQTMGIAIAIDDFGTGYSALGYLHRFPVTSLKIDRSFVSGISDKRDKRELVKVILSIAKTLDIQSVAEGVETPGQAAFLEAHGCQTAQGYLFGKPIPASEFESFFSLGVRP